ncbi:hypothetical protein Nepgr_008356 [Nepenthes gracilis]|uniref:GATA-type domain-containing protein n=1 Tax=Nepenthes gracilis TaxID=150966 RepID=A0AAD3S9J8_NEPGR|nr:hypothetical protein Nepgr_008356 [Nepenthes gracilis]
MLYRTHHHPFFNPFLLSSSQSLPPIPSPNLPPTAVAPLPHQVETEMECVEVALKGDVRPEMMGFGMKRSQQAFLEDLLAVNGQNGGSGDDFFVDQLLNLNNENTEDGLVVQEVEEQKEKSSASLLPPQEQQIERRETSNPTTTSFSIKDDFGSVLAVPTDEADLEWLSHFVEDSFSQFSTPYLAGAVSGRPKMEPETRSADETLQKPSFMTSALTKARRSRRARSGGRVWSFSLTESTAISSSSSTSSSPASSYNPVVLGEEPAAKKQKRKTASESSWPGGAAQAPPRRCSHCGVQKTPQWRTGPMGAKTLCNACGVRYKSGRLLPEYRPACSPTFSSEIHSNNHRKVLEMRRKKESAVMMGLPETDLPPPVPSFG